MYENNIFWNDAFIKGGRGGHLDTGTTDFMNTTYTPTYNGDFTWTIWFNVDTLTVGDINDLIGQMIEI